MIIDGWILHKKNQGETSLQVTLFTHEQGLIIARCRGGRTARTRTLLQPFIPLWLHIESRNGWHYLNKIESQCRYLKLFENNLLPAWYINELLYKVLQPDSPEERLYQAYETTLDTLAQTDDRIAVETTLRRFEWELLTTCGYGLSFHKTANTNQDIHAEKHYTFVANEGFIETDNGPLPGSHLIAIHQQHLNDLAVLTSAKHIARIAIEHVLEGKTLTSRKIK